MQKKHELFLVSMANTMKKLWPPPIKMDSMDEGKAAVEKQELGSRWSTVCDVIRRKLTQMSGCGVDISLGRCTDIGGSITNGNSSENMQSLMEILSNISKLIRGYEEINLDFVIGEIDKVIKSDYTRKQVHWFIDTEILVELTPFPLLFPPNLVSIYVIGDLQTIHNDIDSATQNTRFLEKCGANVRFLMCHADLEDLWAEISKKEIPYEMREHVAKCRIGKETMKVKLLESHRLSTPSWTPSSLRLIGFLPEIDLCRLGFTSQKSGRSLRMWAESKMGKSILWSIGDFMLSKMPRVAVLKWRQKVGGAKAKSHGYSILVAYEDVDSNIALSLIRLPNQIIRQLRKSMRFVEEIDEPSLPLPDDSSIPIACEDHRFIRKRLTDFQKLGLEAKKAKYEKMANEYKFLQARDVFVKFTAPWLNKNGLIGKREEKNNNME